MASGAQSATPEELIAEELITGASIHIDARELLCPEPLLLCRKAMDTLQVGQSVHVTATDPHAEIDFDVYARRSGHAFVLRLWRNTVLHAVIEKRTGVES